MVAIKHETNKLSVFVRPALGSCLSIDLTWYDFLFDFEGVLMLSSFSKVHKMSFVIVTASLKDGAFFTTRQIGDDN